MFLAGGLLWLNTRTVQLEGFTGSTTYNGITYENYVIIQGYGWPLTMARHFIYSEQAVPPGTYWNTWNLLGNIGIALMIVLLSGFVIERVLRMKEKPL